MKPLFLFLILTMSITCYGQKKTIKMGKIKALTIEADTFENKFCKERGHVQGGVGSSTSMYCPSYVIDTDSNSIRVYPKCNTTQYICERCNKSVIEGESEERVIIWQRPKK